MNIQRIEYVIKQIEQSKNYKDFTKLLSLEERKQFINFLLSETEESINFMDEHPILNDENFAGNLFTEDEAEDIYNNEFNELSEEKKVVLILNFKSDNLKLKYLQSLAKDDDKAEIIVSLKDDNLKLKYLQSLAKDDDKAEIIVSLKDDNLKVKYLDILPDLTPSFFSTNYRVQVIESLKDDNLKLKCLQSLAKDSDKVEIIVSLKDDNLKVKCLDILPDLTPPLLGSINYRVQVIESLKDDNLKLKCLQSLAKDDDKAEIIVSLKDDNLKVKYLDILPDLTSSFDFTNCRVQVIKSLKDDNLKLKCLQSLAKDGDKAEIIVSLKDDNLRLEYLSVLTDDYSKSQIIASLKDDNLKVKYLNDLSNDYSKSQIIASLKDDNLKVKYLNVLTDDYCKSQIIESLNDDNLKVKYLNDLSDDYWKSQIIESLKDDNLKLKCLQNLIKDSDKAKIIGSIKDLKIKIKALTFLNSITSYCLNHDWIDKVENVNDDVNREIIKKLALENNLNYDNLFKLFLKLGYGIRTLGNNLEKIVNLKEDEFAKIMQIIDTLKSSKLTMDDVKNFLPTFYERDFRINNKNVILTFSNLKDLIEIKDKKKISDILFEINKNLDINNILTKYNFNLDTFIDNLLENGKNENLLNILHEITDEYLDKMRALYTAERKKSAENELNLDFNFDKNYLISKLFKKYDVQYIYEFINRLINKDKLDDNQKEFLNNESLLIECLKFMKNKENYPRENFPKIQNKLKLLNGILNKLYEDKKLDFLGNIKDEDAKIILKPKEVIANSFFIKLLSELDIDLIENKLLNNHELYEKLLNNIKKYKFMNWTDTFKNILEKADFSFLEMDIAIFINYFYDFYPKLEKEQQEKGRKVSLSNILDEIRTYGSSSVKYNYLLGKEDSNFIISNPTPNSCGLKVEERLAETSKKTLIQFERKYITIPSMNSDISLKNGKKIHVDIGDITSAINLTYGERTGACIRIGGAGSELFDFCLENENGFHVRFTNPITGDFVSRVSGFRNGNTVFLNELRESLDKNISNSDLIDAVSIVARKIVESTKDSKYPIKNVVISSNQAMSYGHNTTTTLDVSNIKEGYDDFYSNVSSTNAIYLERNAEIELGPEKSERYDILRKKIKKFNNFKEINEQIQKFNLINGLLKGQSLGDISLIDENTIMNVNELYVGEDFLIAFDINGNILWKHILERDSCFTLKANEEINVLLNYLSEKSIINEGEKSR